MDQLQRNKSLLVPEVSKHDWLACDEAEHHGEEPSQTVLHDQDVKETWVLGVGEVRV